MGIRGLLLRASLPLLIRLGTMMAKKGSTPFATKIKKGITLDPRDPKTWWMVYAAQKHSRIPIMALMSDHSMFLAGVPAKKRLLISYPGISQLSPACHQPLFSA